MFSAIFVDRPRLAIVIAVVTTIAGALAYMAMPVAQYPDIVPPQVSVTTMYPGANSAVVDATVAQPIEAQVVGVDKMIYMKSTSGDDGSYTLTARSNWHEPGTSMRSTSITGADSVGAAAPEVHGKASTSRRSRPRSWPSSRFIHEAHLRSAFLSNYVTINLLDSIKEHARRRRRATVRGPGLRDARVDQNSSALQGSIDCQRCDQRDSVAKRVGRCRTHRGAADVRRSTIAAQHPDVRGALTRVEEFENIVVWTEPGWLILRRRDVAQPELGAANLDRDTRFKCDDAAAIVTTSRRAGMRSTPSTRRGKALRTGRSASCTIWPGRFLRSDDPS